jgi:hypothetical protein
MSDVEGMAEVTEHVEHVLLDAVCALREVPTSVAKVAALTLVAEGITALRAAAEHRVVWRSDRRPVVCREGIERILDYLIADGAQAWELNDIGGAEALSAAAAALHERLGETP